MDAARAAAMSDPDQNRWFRRRWVEIAPYAPAECFVEPTPELDLRLLGQELLAAWRRERASSETRSQ